MAGGTIINRAPGGLRCRMSMSGGRQARVRAGVFQNDGVLQDTELELSANGWYIHTHTHTHTRDKFTEK